MANMYLLLDFISHDGPIAVYERVQGGLKSMIDEALACGYLELVEIRCPPGLEKVSQELNVPLSQHGYVVTPEGCQFLRSRWLLGLVYKLRGNK